MNLPDLDQVTGYVHEYGQPVLIGAGAIGAIVIAWVIRRFLKTGHAHTKVGTLGVILATGFAAEGMWQVARDKLHLSIGISVVLFAVFEVVTASQGLLAKHKLKTNATADISRHMTFVWVTSAASGVISSMASRSIPEFLLRIALPVLAAGIWWMDLTADRPGSGQKTSWIWTPRRIGIQLGLVRPGEQDLEAVDRNRRIEAMTVTAHRLHHGSPRLARARRAKLRRLALVADDSMVAEAQRRVARVNRIEALTAPGAKVDAVDEETRDTLDEVRLIMREATTRTRMRTPLALGHPDRILDRPRVIGMDQPADQMWSNDVVRMPVQIADQIRTPGPDQAGALAAVAEADQPEPAGPVSDQAVPATARTATVRRTTARIDEPGGPGDEVPPRVREMAKALARTYRRGEIPARRTVMERMGWTSAGDASAAINLVRAQRSRTTDVDHTD